MFFGPPFRGAKGRLFDNFSWFLGEKGFFLEKFLSISLQYYVVRIFKVDLSETVFYGASIGTVRWIKQLLNSEAILDSMGTY